MAPGAKQSKSTGNGNLRPRWKPGESGNPKGRPKKGFAISDILNSLGDTADESGVTRREALLEKVYTLAEAGDLKAIQFIADRTEGKPRQAIDITEHKPEPVKIIEVD